MLTLPAIKKQTAKLNTADIGAVMVAFGDYFVFNTTFFIAMAFHCRFFFAERYCNVTQEQLYNFPGCKSALLESYKYAID